MFKLFLFVYLKINKAFSFHNENAFKNKLKYMCLCDVSKNLF